MSAELLKRKAARAALTHVQNGMRLGLGTGSTAKHFVELLAKRVADDLKVICVPTSEVIAAQAQGLSIPLTTLDETPQLDLTVDGADEIDEQLRLIKGGGAALLREKIVASASRSMIVIADISKRVPMLGQFPLPIEVNSFGLAATQRQVEKVCNGRTIALRRKPDGTVLVTDSGQYILDAQIGCITSPEALDEALRRIPGVVEHGLFLQICNLAYLASSEGVAVMRRTA
jgi:ribose 5-phosphate isomerase A